MAHVQLETQITYVHTGDFQVMALDVVHVTDVWVLVLAEDYWLILRRGDPLG